MLVTYQHAWAKSLASTLQFYYDNITQLQQMKFGIITWVCTNSPTAHIASVTEKKAVCAWRNTGSIISSPLHHSKILEV